MDVSSYETLLKTHIEKAHVQKESCVYAQVANMLITSSESKTYSGKCEILPKKKNYLCYVGAYDEHDSGVVYSNGKTVRAKCFSCKGSDSCAHLRKHTEEFKKQNASLFNVHLLSHSAVG